MRHWLLKQAERGVSDANVGHVPQELGQLAQRLRASGFTCFGDARTELPVAEVLLPAHDVHMSYAQLLGDVEEAIQEEGRLVRPNHCFRSLAPA